MEKKVTRGRKPKVQISQPIINEELVNEVVQESVQEVVQEPLAPKTQLEESVSYMYRCIECGNVQLVKRCQRCSSHLVRPI
jgi:uncharacterized Zn finger protein